MQQSTFSDWGCSLFAKAIEAPSFRAGSVHRIIAYLPVHQGVSFMKKKFSVLVEKDEDGYLVATVPTLPGCHTQARSMDDLLERVKEAIEAYLDMQIIGD